MLTIDKSGLRVQDIPDDLEKPRKQFQQNHYLRLPSLINSELLEELHQEILASDWQERTHEGIGVELCLNEERGTVGLLNFLLNDYELFTVIEKLTACAPIGNFTGRVYRMMPDPGHYDSWHTDFGENRLLALSINLGKEIYKGGVLQLRLRANGANPVEVPNTRFGDAILFRLDPNLEHRVTHVEGNEPKTAFAGWFRSGSRFWSSLAEKEFEPQRTPRPQRK